MKKLISFCLALAMAASLAACSQSGSGSSSQTAEESSSSAVEESSAAGEESSAAEASETPETVTITSLNGEGAETQLEVPYDPQRIAILDMASLDILDALGVGGRVVGTASTSLDYLQSYINEDIANLGTIKEADLEAIMSCEPDVIFMAGGWQAPMMPSAKSLPWCTFLPIRNRAWWNPCGRTPIPSPLSLDYRRKWTA